MRQTQATAPDCLGMNRTSVAVAIVLLSSLAVALACSRQQQRAERPQQISELHARLCRLNGRLSVNEATADELALVPQIGPRRAADLVRVRRFLRGFSDQRHLSLVPGIGIKRLQRLSSRLKVETR